MNEWEPPELCKDCKEPLSGTATLHGLEGFGHQFRCCKCYDRAMGIPTLPPLPENDAQQR